MSVYLLTKHDQIGVFKKIAACIETPSSKVVLFTEPTELDIALNLAPPDEVELVLMDCRFFQMDLYNPYMYMAKRARPVPLVIYNDPYPQPENRVAYWIVKNRYYLSALLKEDALDNIKNILDIIQGALMTEEIGPYVSVVCPAKKYLTAEGTYVAFDPEKFRKKHFIMPSRFKLFEYLYANIEQVVSEEDICMHLWNTYNDNVRKNLYTYIHDLRQIFLKETDLIFRIDRYKMKHYRLNVTLGETNRYEIPPDLFSDYSMH